MPGGACREPSHAWNTPSKGFAPMTGPSRTDYPRVRPRVKPQPRGLRHATNSVDSGPKHEINRAHEAEAGPEIVPFQGLAHIKDGEGHEDGQGDDLLGDLHLPQAQGFDAGAVARHLEAIFKKCYAPARQNGDPNRSPMQILEVGVPGERHENVAAEQKQHETECRRHALPENPPPASASQRVAWVACLGPKPALMPEKCLPSGRVELPTFGLGNRCSIQLSYEDMKAVLHSMTADSSRPDRRARVGGTRSALIMD